MKPLKLTITDADYSVTLETAQGEVTVPTIRAVTVLEALREAGFEATLRAPYTAAKTGYGVISWKPR
ncbi:hypothetical protein [Streptomyces anulatus]|uniref:hypothetical protein n=1 Tax=Streptomyces anulatus TaxID=1892 RepID=UPI003F49D560